MSRVVLKLYKVFKMANIKKFESARGTLEWVTITGEGKPNMSGKLEYLASLVLEGDAATALKAEIDAFWAENKPAKFSKGPKSTGYYPHTEATGEVDEDGKKIYAPTGKTLFRFKTGTTYTDGKQKLVQVYNSKGNKVVLGDTQIGNGSVGRIKGAMGIYINANPKTQQVIDAGVTLYLDSIMLLKLEQYEAGGFSTHDEDAEFEAIGEEFVGEEAAPEQSASPAKTRL